MPLTMSSSDKDCMGKCMHELKHNSSKQRSHEQMVAICMKQCGKAKNDITYVPGYFKGTKKKIYGGKMKYEYFPTNSLASKLRVPNTNCVKTFLDKILKENPYDAIEDALQNAYQFCISETDFSDIIKSDMHFYGLLRNISSTLAEYKQDFYILNDSEIMSAVTPGKSMRVEPMKTLAEAATSGAKKSSNINKVGFFNNILEIEFNSGDHYIYFVDDPSFYDDFVAAPSKGKYLWEKLRGKKIGLVWGYATGTGSKKQFTPGGVGGSIVPYSKGSINIPEFEPRMPTERERSLVEKEIQIQFLGKGLKYKKTQPELERLAAHEELRAMFSHQPKLPQIKDMDIKEDSMDELIGWVKKEIGAKGDEAVGIAFAISKARKTQKKEKISEEKLDQISHILTYGKKQERKEAYNRFINIEEQAKNIPNLSEKIKANIEITRSMFERGNFWREYKQYDKERNETGWKEIWESQVSKYDRYKEAAERYKKYKQGQQYTHQSSLYSKLDFEGIPLITDKAGILTEDFGVCKKRYDLLYDFYHMEDEKERNKLQTIINKYDVNIKEDTEMRGVITRAGPFDYGGKIVYKDWNNLIENAIEYPVLPVYGSKYTNPHKEENSLHLIGYVDSWGQDDPKNEHLYGTIHTFEPIEKISDLDNPENIQVSLSMYDDAPEDSEQQHIVGFRNVAVALNNQIQGRCESVDDYGSCVVNPIEDMNNQANNLSQIIIKKPTGSSGLKKGARKIITKKNDLHMPDENKKVKEDIAKFIADFKGTQKKEKDDALAVSTGNEVEGFTLEDEFYRTMFDEGWSKPAIDKAWAKYNAQNKEAGGEVDVTTYGFNKTAPGISGDFEKKLDSVLNLVEKQSEKIQKYEDFFQAKQLEVETEMKTKYKKPFSEETQKLIEKLDFDTLETIQPLMEALIEEHPEIMPIDKEVDAISDMNTNRILKALGKDKANLRKVKDDMEKIKNDAIERMNKKWGKKGE